MTARRRITSRPFLCACCGTSFTRSYHISNKRAENPQYCSRECAANKRKPTPMKDRFWSKVRVGSERECWPWQGAIREGGYGWFNPVVSRSTNAHRVAYMLTKGEIPRNLFVCHSGDPPPCCNPAHLWLGTSAENTKDMDRKGRRRIRSLFGEDHQRSKLTESDVRAILSSPANGKTLSKEYGVSSTQIYNIKHGRAWPHIKRPSP
jgi:hypothetical protein